MALTYSFIGLSLLFGERIYTVNDSCKRGADVYNTFRVWLFVTVDRDPLREPPQHILVTFLNRDF